MGTPKRQYTAELKLKAVLESYQRHTTIESVKRRYGLSNNVLNKWREEFRQQAPEIFLNKRSIKNRSKTQGYPPGESPEELKKIIGELTVQNEILKKMQRYLE